ncbi:MAG: S8 family serine peptidase [candidate division Zixibacteria bacterium]
MKRSLKFVIAGLAILIFASGVNAGEYSADFELYQADNQQGEMTGAIITMTEQVDLEALKQELNARRADRREWHETVVLALQENATVNQADILAQLEELTRQGMVEKYRNLWVGNVILVNATQDALDILVARNDVLMIHPDYPVESIEPVSKGDDSPTIAGVENGLRAIRADEVWAMGITGAGRLVSHLDTGVDGNHSALNSRWRGYDSRYENNPGWAWFDPLSNTQFPQDWGSHGTHTMGTICGLGESSGDTIGVAFGAEWISCGVIDRAGIPQTVADALLSFEWITDPDGDPGTVWDVPDVNSNSWGLTTGHGYPPCDQTFWTVLDGCEASGIFVVFAAGNEGPGQRSLRNPATRASTDIQSFSIGALDGNNENLPIAGFSSRGPSDCTPDGNDTFKPEVSAPGVSVRSSIPGGGYQGGWSGTSMACPHVAGVVALMREANPNLTTDQIGEILLETAVDLGDSGEDNAYGMGVVDAYEAVIRSLAYLEGWGTLVGYVTDEASGDPIQGATVGAVERPWSATTNGAGYYSLFMPADTLWAIRVDHSPNHLPVFDDVMLAENETLFVDYALEGKVTVTLNASFANPEDASYRSFYLKGSWDNDGFYDASWSGDFIEVTDDDEDGVYTTNVLLARDTQNTYSWAIYSENYAGEAARLDDGADFDIPTLDPPSVPTIVVNPSGSDNNWIISVEGDNGLSLDLMQGVDNNENKWGAATALTGGVTYTFRFHVMHSGIASYGSGGVGGVDLVYTPEVDGSFDFYFNDYDDSYLIQLTGTEGPPTYLSTQSNLDGHIPVSWLPPGTVESQEMAYDDGVLMNAYYYYAYDAMMATMFVPQSHPVTIDSVLLHVLTEGDPYWPWPDGNPDPIGISIFLDNGSGMPENDAVFYTETTGELGDWIRVDIDEVLVSEGNFWVAMNNLAGGGEEGIGLDVATDYPGNQWVYSAGIWGLQEQYAGDHMIRAKVFGGGRRFWLGYDAEMANTIPYEVPIFTNSDGTDGTAGHSPSPVQGAASDSRMTFDRMSYYPNVSPTHPPIGSDIQVLAGYNLYRDVATAPFDRDMQINTDLISESNYDDWGDDPYGPIVNGILYYYQASAVYDIGEGQFVEVGPSNEATGMATNHPPQPPENLVGSSLADTVYLSWDLVDDYDIAEYLVFRRDYGGSEFNLVGTVEHPVNTFSEVINVDGIYRYKVASADVEGMQSDGYSNSVDVPIGAIPPRQLTATTDLEFRVDLDWRHPGGRPMLPNMNVLVIAADNATMFVSELGGFEDVEVVDYYDARNGTPSLDELSEYDITVVWSNYLLSDPYAMGDVLADYVDNGGGVVLQQFSFGSGWNLDGRIMNEYSPLSIDPTLYMTQSLGDYDSGHPIMDGVGDVTDQFMAGSSIINGGEWVASWGDGTPLVAYNPEVNVVAVNSYIGDSRQFTGDMIMLVHNAMNYALGGAEVIPDNYKVYKSDNESGPYNEIVELPGDVREYTDAPVPNGVDYYYFITAMYPGPEESDPSNIAMGHGQNHPPLPPENLEASVDDRDISLTWTFEDVMGDLDHFNVYKRISPGGDFEFAGSTTNMFLTITIPEGEDGTYAIAVAAVDDGSPQMESGYSGQVYASVGNLPPLNLRGADDQEDIVPLWWSQPGLLPCTTLVYDDGALMNGYYYFAFDAIIANRFVASSPVQVETLWVHVLTEGDPFWPWPDGNHDPVGISLWDDDGNGYPGDMAFYAETVCNNGEWIMVPIEGGALLNGPNFWIGFQNLEGGGEDGMGLDANTDFPEHKWVRQDGSWAQQDQYNGDQMIRATIVSGGRRLLIDENNPIADLVEGELVSKSTPDIPEPLDTQEMLGYNVYRAESPDVPIEPENLINDGYVIDPEYDDTEVVNGTTYYYVVTAVYDNDGDIEESPPSNEVALTPRMGARMELDPLSFEVGTDAGEIITRDLNISNPGGLELVFAIDTQVDRRRLDEPDGDSPNWTFEAQFSSHEEEFDKSDDPIEPVNPPMILDRGGPDDYGYTWIDSDEPGGPEFDWADIEGRGTPVYMSDDDNQGPFEFGFVFPFYGNNFTSLRICSNGWASFTSTSGVYFNYPIPDPSQPENLIAPFWDDLNPSQGGQIWFFANSDSAVVSWIDVPHYGSGGPYTFQLILTSNGRIKYNYASMGYPDDSATLGIQNGSGSIGLQIAYDQPYIHDGLAILIQEGWLSADPRSGNIAAGDDFDATIIFDATTLEEGTYTGALTVTGFDVNHMVDQITVPVTFHVGITGVDDGVVELPTAYNLSQNYPNPFNPTTEIDFALPENGHVTLEVFNVLGQKVRTLVDEDMNAGYQSITWMGDDEQGNNVSSGIYLYKLEAGDKTFTKKMLMLK